MSPHICLTNESVGCNALSELLHNDSLTPALINQQPEEDSDYVELYGVCADTEYEGDSNDAYEGTYDHDKNKEHLNTKSVMLMTLLTPMVMIRMVMLLVMKKITTMRNKYVLFLRPKKAHFEFK